MQGLEVPMGRKEGGGDREGGATQMRGRREVGEGERVERRPASAEKEVVRVWRV